MSVDKDTGKGLSQADYRRMRLDAEVAELKRPGITNAQIAERLSPDLRADFWRRELDAYFAEALGPDA